MNKYLLSALLCLLAISNSFSQTDKTTISGKVTDINNIPLSKATITDVNSGTTSFSDINGFYSINLPKPKKSVKLKFSFVGYSSFTKTIDLNNQNEVKLDVALEIKAVKIKEVQITGTKDPDIAYGNSKDFIQDYEFCNNNILLLLEEKNKQYLRLVTDNDSLIFNHPLSEKIRFIWKDCTGSIFLVGNDSLYKLELSTLRYYVEDVLPAELFYTTLAPCVLSLSGNIYLQNFYLHNQQTAFFKIQKSNKEERLFKTIVSKETAMAAAYQASKIGMLTAMVAMPSAENMMPPPDQKLADELKKQDVYTGRKLFDEQAYYKFIISKPIYTPLTFIRDSIYLFDHVNDSIFTYNRKGELQRSFTMAYHKTKTWAKELIINEEHNQAFAKFDDNGAVYLQKIDLNTATISDSQKLTYSTFPEKTKIKNGYIYYLYNERNNEFSTKKLYKQALK